jgi:hypothetical protein
MKKQKGNGNIRNVDNEKSNPVHCIRNPTNVNKKDFKGIRKVFS